MSSLRKSNLLHCLSAPNYCGEFDNAGAMMSIDETLMCSFQILKPAEKEATLCVQEDGFGWCAPTTPPRGGESKG